MKQETIQIRVATPLEIDWINRRYDEVEFMHSTFEKEIVAIAEYEGQKAGLGRLVKIGPTQRYFELGGIYVFEAFRGKGIARKIVKFLLQQTLPSQTIYCIPFEHLIDFYREFGFKPCLQTNEIPPELLEKRQWCQEKYPQPTSLLILNK